MNIEWRAHKTHFIEYTLPIFESELKQASIEIIEFDIKFGEIFVVCRSTD